MNRPDLYFVEKLHGKQKPEDNLPTEHLLAKNGLVALMLLRQISIKIPSNHW